MSGPAEEELLYAGIPELSRRLRARTLSPVALCEAALARVEAHAPGLHCFVTVTAERAREDARRAEGELAAGRWRGPLHGLPCGVKDLLDVAGVPTTCGARPYAGRVPERDATLAARLREAGAVLIGKLSLIELAGGLGYHQADAAINGACRTPWDLARWAGGSSSGSAAAVAAGLVTFAIGSETWGSITCPSAFCGVTGLRPTYGVLSRKGAMALSYTLDKLGPMARSAEDCALVLAALAGPDPADPTSIAAPPGLAAVRAEAARGLRAAVIDLPDKPAVSAATAAAWEKALAAFERAGLKLEPARFPDFPWEDLATLFIEAEAGTAFEDLIRTGRTRQLADRSHQEKKPEDYLPLANASDYVRAMRLRGEGQRIMSRFLEGRDLVLAPNMPWVAPLVTQSLDLLFEGVPDPVGAAGNLCGLPAAAVPMGFAGPGKLPVGLQLMGRPREEGRVLSAAALFQSVTDFHRQRPPLPLL
ncbi:MAG TPA: amidase [Anaeromyxobacteraceae bacterium]|jgi:aspartyl-tRNA(Asn)/glutamyl-tRNA(Gln) amidotransferase subunit A|nr:amidase [Anaeromyxobacteraceae bacterium]